MPKKVRVFISSTMKDLANERQEIVSMVQNLGFEAVYAEALLPSGESSWIQLKEEIISCHIFILVLGVRYGWVPDSGPGAGMGKSVTHLEYDEAKLNDIPIMPFFQNLEYNSGTRSPEDVLRDNFRRDVASWDTGLFRADFNLAKDLGEKVHFGLVGVFTDSFLKELIRKKEARHLLEETLPLVPKYHASPNIFHSSEVLLAGAGMSMSAGYPSATVLAELLGRELDFNLDGTTILNRYSFADLAFLVEERLGRSRVIETILEVMNTALPVIPTEAHRLAVLKYQSIVTTNYDSLFESACKIQGLQFIVKTAGNPAQSKPGVIDIYKIDGSVEDPGSLVLTPADHAKVRADSLFWEEMDGLMQSCKVTVIGHSLRDPSSRWLLQHRNKDLDGIYVSPYLDELDAVLFNRFKLTGIKSNADDFMTELTNSISSNDS